MALLEVQDIHKTYHIGEVDVAVLRGVSLAIERGELVALTGSSGSGKTTLMNILGCLDRPSSGRYLFDGRDIAGLTQDEQAGLRNSKLGFVFQSFNLLARTSALENVMMPLAYRDPPLPATEEHARAKRLLEQVGLGERLDHEPSQLSGGQQQRVAIARALVNEPEILFGDEPTGNLDSKTSVDILRMFRELNEQKGITIVLVTHDPEVARAADRTIRIKDGRVEAIE